MNNYTKGEWKKYGRHIHINTSNTSDEIATVLWPDWMPESESVANAHLISAAMDMYEALKQVEVDYETLCNRKPKNTLLQTRLRMLKQALDKANAGGK